ncbi:MAG: outer membrane protein assembly factor BamD [Rhodoferax sp.]|jgi:tetratricopeptide (TPR) repeat protein|nr:outer membrane protein assembly factor BamD [Rhodoferax sp.]
MRNINSYLLTPLIACVCAGFSVSAQAVVLDDVQLRQEGANAVLQISFVTPVQYSRSVSARASDVVQAFYTVLPTRTTLNLDNTERRLKAGGQIPSFSVRDESAAKTSVTSTNRRLVVSFAKPVKFKVRSGKTNRSIELVLEGLGESVKAVQVANAKPVPAAAVVVLPTPEVLANQEIEASAKTLLATAQSAFDSGQYDAATESLNKLLNLPPSGSSRKAQELAGLARLNAGDKARAATEFETFLKLYPTGPDSDRVRQLVATLPKIGPAPELVAKVDAPPTSTTSGSVSSFYYGGNSATCTEDKQNSLLGCQELLNPNAQLSSATQKQLQTSLDLNWRFRDTEKDMRFVFRDSSTADFLKNTSKERLTAMYFDYKSLTKGANIRLGRQSPTGGGVLYRFDGVQAGYSFAPKWKVNGVLGKPTDDLLDAKRQFYGMSVDAEALTKELSGSAFLLEQTIDGETDRRAIGVDLRYFKGGLSASSQLDYDLMIKKVNIASIQGNWQVNDMTSFNVLLDRRTTPILTLGNILFFQTTATAKRVSDLLGTQTVEQLRETVNVNTAYQNQFRIGATRVLNANWQTGADFSVSNVDEIKPNQENLTGSPASGNLWSTSVQLIGSNLYSLRDTHVFNVSFLGGPNDHGTLLSYNNLTSLGEKWQLEPSVKYYSSSSNQSGTRDTWTLGMRGTFRVRNQVSLESEVTYELTDAVGTTTSNSSSTNYYLGARVDF